jgi:Tol biopolymer transport system component
MRIEMEDALTASPAPDPTITTLTKVPHQIHRRWAIASGLVCLTVAAITGWAVWNLRSPAPTGSPTVRSTVLVPANLSGVPSSRLALSPDGRRLAFVAPNENGRAVLWVRALDGLMAQPLAGTEGGQAPFWSPDSRFLAFFADNKLKKIDASGGPTLLLCDAFLAPNAVAAWSRDNVILFNATTNSPLSRVAAAGGTPSVVTALDIRAGEVRHTLPFFLPDGQHFLYGATTTDYQRALGVYVASLNSTGRTRLLEGASHARYTQGHLLFLRGTTLMAQPFDPTRLMLSGEAMPVADQVQTDPAWRGAFALSDTGVVAYQAGASSSRLLWFDRAGNQKGVLSDRANYDDVFLSPDGTRASVSIRESGTSSRSIWTVDVASGRRIRFTFDAGEQFEAPWSFDGSQRVFNSPRKGHLDLYRKSSSGAGSEDELLADDVDKYPQSLSPDGRFLIYMVFGVTTGQDLRILPLTGERKPFDLLATPDNEGGGQFSPDGRWIAYWSNATGRNEVFVARFPGAEEKWQVSATGGIFPRWRADGKEIFYRSPDNKLMAASVNGQGSSFVVNAVRPLFDVRPGGPHWFYNVAPDGQHFLVNTAEEQTTSAPITLVVNWPAALKP